jgi:hypothetical protein
MQSEQEESGHFSIQLAGLEQVASISQWSEQEKSRDSSMQ